MENATDLDITVLKKAIDLTEKKVNFRCKKYPTKKECPGCPEHTKCGGKNIIWNCDAKTLTFFEQSLNELDIADHKPYIEYVQEHGGYCDCEIIFNVKESPDFKKKIISIKMEQPANGN